MSETTTDPRASPSRTKDESDARLLERLRQNDRDALAELYDVYSRLAFALAYRVVGESREAEDVVQESFLTLWRQADRLDRRRGKVRSYLLTIVHRRAIDALRRRSGRPEADLDVVAPMPSSEPDPLDAATAGERRETIERALDELPQEQRRAVELTYFGGLTVVEMAREQDVPLGTAKSRLRLALQRLRRTLSGEQAHEL